MTLQEQIQDLQNQRVQQILSDERLSKIEKLYAIEIESLWPYAGYIQEEFEDWTQECIQLEYNQAKQTLIDAGGNPDTDYFYASDYCDTIFADPEQFNRYEQVSYATQLDGLKYLQDDDGLIDVVTSAGDFKSTIRKSIPEIIDAVFDYAVKNQIVGFEYDW